MRSIIQTADFKSWIKGLKDTVGAARINVRLARLKKLSLAIFDLLGMESSNFGSNLGPVTASITLS
jgi:hypothetical protein